MGRVMVEGKIVHKAKFIVEKGNKVTVSDREIAAQSSPPPAPKKKHSRVKVLFEDEHIIIVNKQAGLLSVSTDKMEPDTLHSRVVDYLKSENEKSWAFIVHRLDRETSGVMILAKHKRHKEYFRSNLQIVMSTEYTTHCRRKARQRKRNDKRMVIGGQISQSKSSKEKSSKSKGSNHPLQRCRF